MSRSRTKSAARALSEDEKREISEAFDLFDAAKSGAIDYHALKVAMRALGFPVTKEEARDVITQRGSGGVIDKDVFTTVLTEMYAARDPEEELKKAFRLFAEDGKGLISLRGLRKVVAELGEGSLSDAELQAMIDEFDVDGDGAINEAEFLAIMRASTVGS